MKNVKKTKISFLFQKSLMKSSETNLMELLSILSLSSLLRWNTIWWCDIDVHIVANLKFRLSQWQWIVCITLSRARNADFSHSISWPEWIRWNECKVEISSLPTCFWIHVAHKGGQFAKRRVLPCINLELVAWYIAMVKLIRRMMTTSWTEYPKQQRTSLENNREIIVYVLE